MIGALGEIRSGSSIQITDDQSRANGDRPDFLGSSASDAILDGWDTGGSGPWLYLDAGAFARVPLNEFSYQMRPGTAGRRFIVGPGFWTIDVNLAKRFRFESGFSFQLRAEIFNLFNHLNYGGPENEIDAPDFGVIDGASSPRTWQLGVRFDF
jgi:hypothetical protein